MEKKIDEEARNASKVSEWAKKTILSGLGAVFLTEEGIMNALGDLKLPKSVIASALAQAEKTKSELSGMVAHEVKQFLGKIEIDEIIRKVLRGQTIEISATIKFSDKNATKKAAPKAARRSKKNV